MTYPDSSIVLTIPLDDNGEIHDTLVVPPGDPIVFTLRALDNKGRLLYVGSQTRPVAPGQQVEINILLLPNPELLMLRVGPLFQSVVPPETSLAVYVDIYNVDSLAGAAFRISYDPRILRFSQAVEGEFLRSISPTQTLFFYRHADSADYVACGVARTLQPGLPIIGVTGSGRLATFVFSRLAAGSTSIAVVLETVELTRPNGFPVNRLTSLVLESATVEVR
jgi:hypothetical protein